MNIFYEESGRFKTATVVNKTENAYQADTVQGKRVKVKAANVFIEFDGAAEPFLVQAERDAADIDIDLLWSAAGETEFSARDIAVEYFGREPKPHELAAVLVALYAAPVYFHKKTKGIFKAASEEVLQQALAAIERKKQQDAQLAAWVADLQEGVLPAEVAADLPQILHMPDKQALTYKAFSKAAETAGLTPYELARKTGGVASLAQFLTDGFLLQHFPKGTQAPLLPVPSCRELPLAEGVRAFSIDDESTTEIDDALSVAVAADGTFRVGIHIAVPALAVAADGAVCGLVAERQSTVYFPGGKITMLPENWIGAFSLDCGVRPALSVYFDVDADFQVALAAVRAERVEIAENLRIQHIEPLFNRERGLDGGGGFPYHDDLRLLYRLAIALQQQRGRYEADRPVQYDYGIELASDGRVAVSRRERGSPIDTLVSEMMILANSTWAKMLDDAGLPGLFRVQPPLGKVRTATRPEPHSGMNLSHYGWFTSPLRRAADCINQQQLLSLLLPDYPARFQNNDTGLYAAVRDFETAYAAYAAFQRDMESYWSLVYIEQQGLRELAGVVLKEDLVRIDGLPLVSRAVGIPFDLPPRSRVCLTVAEVDSERRFLALKYIRAASG